jgi:hypothetical protein
METVKTHKKRIMRKLEAKNFTHAVTIMWRACLIEADDIAGGSRSLRLSRRVWDDDAVAYMVMSYKERMKYVPPPIESFYELQERCHRIANEVRARRSN